VSLTPAAAPDLLSELESLRYAHNYFRWIADVFKRYTGGRVLEAGAGFGYLTKHFTDAELLVALDIEDMCVERLEPLLDGWPNAHVLKADLLDQVVVETLRPYELDTVINANVFEHIEDDVLAMTHLRESLPGGGTMVTLVPAHKKLYGSLDAIQGHFRRYEKDELVGKLRDAGWQVEDCFHFNSLAAAGRWWMGIARKQESTGEGQIKAFDRFAVPVVSRVERYVRPPFGQSLIAVTCAA
jgi:2-polyprenyl-3-methyl-5-hydroxy-6-metoxy-1,4-benzoquinol methylase